MSGIILRARYIIKLGGDEGVGLVLSGVYFEGDRDGNLEGAGPVDFDPLGNSEGTGFGIKLDIYNGEGTCSTLGAEYRRKLWGDEGSRLVLSGGFYGDASYFKFLGHRRKLPVLCYHKIMVILPYPFLW